MVFTLKFDIESQRPAHNVNTNLTMNLEWLNRLPLACNTTANQTANWNFEDWTRGRSPIDFGTCVFECVSYEAFWIILIILIINAFFCNTQLNGFKKCGDEITDTLPTYNSDTEPKRHGPCWMQRHLKSRPWIVLVINLCFLMAILAMLEGFAVLLTAWRFTLFFIQLTFPAWEPRALAFVTYSPMSLIILLAWAGVFWAGQFILKVQFGLMRELMHLYWENPKKTVVKNEDVDLEDLVQDEEDATCPPAYGGWERAELRVL
ncbi:hypothetical protein CEP54_005460 [Fusarium duplospermum]|uniref:Uncharacterized protein n=1 Tax=Fusarium duplospermum TaxID=1325734 RepID=A0A428QC88_9HYPO|nr:hypothetical protein CEP54_005460 [Fusarium duplospermum]